MNVQYAFFKIPLCPDGTETEDLNKFLRSHRVVQTIKEIVSDGGASFWAFSVEYLLDGNPEGKARPQGKIDYREILNDADFKLFARLRALRKELAEREGVPVYAVFTNDQLADMATRRPASIADLKNLAGIGEGRSGRFGQPFVDVIAAEPK